MDPKISVIIPYHNAERWIKRCIDSLKRQPDDLEYIFVDDHSTDDGYDILRKETDDDGRFIRIGEWSDEGRGVSWARNRGLDCASGDWVTFLDADDELLPRASYIFRCMTELDETANIIQANHLGQFTCMGPINRYPNEKGIYGPSDLTRLHSWCMVWNKIYRASFLKENGISFKEGVQYGEDELFNLRCIDRDPRIFHTLHTTCTVLHYYNNMDSLSNTKTAEELLQQSQEMAALLPEIENVQLRASICMILSKRWRSRLIQVFTK